MFNLFNPNGDDNIMLTAVNSCTWCTELSRLELVITSCITQWLTQLSLQFQVCVLFVVIYWS